MDKLLDFDRGHLTPGLRNSTDCPVRRVLEYFEEHQWKYFAFDKGVSTMGHIVATHFVNRHLRGLETEAAVGRYHHLSVFGADEFPYELVEVEVGLDWGVGVTHLDAVAADSVWEIKTYNDSTAMGRRPNPNPSQQNISQVYRQRVCADISGTTLPDRWFIQMIGKNNGDLPEPFLVDFRKDRLDSTHKEIEAVVAAYEQAQEDDPNSYTPEYFKERGLECRCAACWPKPREEANQTVSHLLDRHKNVKAALADAEEERKNAAAEKKEYKAELEDIKTLLSREIDRDVVVEDEDSTASFNKNGVLQVKEKRGK